MSIAEITESTQTITVALASCSCRRSQTTRCTFLCQQSKCRPIALVRARTLTESRPREARVRHLGHCSTGSHAVRLQNEFAFHSSNSNSLRPLVSNHVELRSKCYPAWCSIDASWRYERSQADALPAILTCAYSKPCPPKPRSFHIRSLPTSSTCCSCRGRYTNPGVRSSMCPHLNPAIRCENPDGHRHSQELAHQKAKDTLPRSLNMSRDVLMMSSLQYRGFILSPRSTANHVPVDCGREGATMDNLIVCGHEQCHLG